MAGIVLRLLFSRGGIVVMIGLALFTWHTLDKGSAVRQAVVQYVAGVELAAAEAELAEMKRRAVAANVAAEQLQEKVAAAEGEALRMSLAIEEWESSNAINADGVVDARLLERLRGR